MTLGLVLLRETISVLMECDDSAGNIGGAVSGAVDLLRDVGLDEDTALPLRRELFDILAKEVLDKRYFDYGDTGLDLLDVLYKTAIRLHEPDLFLDLIGKLLLLQKAESSIFHRDYLRTGRVKFLRETGRNDEADQQIQASMDIVSVRAQVVDEAIRTNNYDRAKTLIREGIQLAEAKKHPGIVSQWMLKLLGIAELERKNVASLIMLVRKNIADSRPSTDALIHELKATFIKRPAMQDELRGIK